MKPVALVVAAALAGCVPRAVERDLPSMCRIARDVPVTELSLHDLVELTAPFPRAHHYAAQAYELRTGTYIMTGFGAAALAGALITGFATDTSTNQARAALGSTVGVTIALGLGAAIAGGRSVASRQKAIGELRDEVNHYCPEPDVPPPPPVPPQ
jgi:hypothetical protein